MGQGKASRQTRGENATDSAILKCSDARRGAALWGLVEAEHQGRRRQIIKKNGNPERRAGRPTNE